MILLQKYLIHPIRDFIYPPACLTCDRLLIELEERVCSNCWDSFTSIDQYHPTWIQLKLKFNLEGFIKDITSCYLFEKEGRLQEVIHLLKYQSIKTLGVMLGRELGKKICADSLFSGGDYLIPIPLHKLKQRERGYNQSDYICKGLLETSGIPIHSSMIYRRKYTQSQTQLNLQERIENVRDSFEVDPKFRPLIAGKSFILVDDVITTGSTINACARELINLNARNIFAASIALAQ